MSESTTPEPAGGEAGSLDAASLFSLLGRAHTLEILHEVLIEGESPFRFSELQDELGLSPNTLSRRLEELVEAGFLTRTSYDEIPPRVEYEATEQLAALEPTFRELSAWMEQYGDESCVPEQ